MTELEELAEEIETKIEETNQRITKRLEIIQEYCGRITIEREQVKELQDALARLRIR